MILRLGRHFNRRDLRKNVLDVKAHAAGRELTAQTESTHGGSDSHGAKQAFEAAVRIDEASPAGRDALKRLRSE